MKLWILAPREEYPFVGGDRTNPADIQRNPWILRYEVVYEQIVRAETEEQARTIAEEHAGYEHIASPWLNPALTICEELTNEGAAELIMQVYHGG